MLLHLLLLTICAFQMQANADTSPVTFETRNMAAYRLVQPPNPTVQSLNRIEMNFRTSQKNTGTLIIVSNPSNEEVVISTSGSYLGMLLKWWIPKGGNSSRFVRHRLFVRGGFNGEWHRLSVGIQPDGQITMDGGQAVNNSLPSNFTARFPYDNTTRVTVGSYFRGCLANVTLDGVVRVPLHSRSELLNQTVDILAPIEAELLPESGPGCHQMPCTCGPHGRCVYRQWDLLERCDCSTGYREASLCYRDFLNCQNLELQPRCFNGSTCEQTGNRWCTCGRIKFDSYDCSDGKVCLPITGCRQSEFNCASAEEYLPWTGALCRCSTIPKGGRCTKSSDTVRSMWLTVFMSVIIFSVAHLSVF